MPLAIVRVLLGVLFLMTGLMTRMYDRSQQIVSLDDVNRIIYAPTGTTDETGTSET